MVRFTDDGGDETVAPVIPNEVRLSRDGGVPEVAPVIPIFGDGRHSHGRAHVPARPGGGVVAAPVPMPVSAPTWRSTWDDDPADDGEEYADHGDDACTAIEREIAERNLTKRLRTRQLSVSEARVVVAERDLDPEAIEAVLERFEHLGYLDDAALAEQLVHAGVERKGQGRQVLAQTLVKRGIARDAADAALASLPDDDAERALAFARTRAQSMTSLDRDTAVRRLAGQLARRGYGSSALSAARQAIDEALKASGVRFR